MDEKELKKLFATFAKKRLFLVSPSKMDRKQIKGVLREAGIVDVQEADNVEEAWNALELKHTNLLVLSVSTPEYLDYFERILDSARFNETPLLVFTNKIFEHKKVYKNSGAQLYFAEEPMNALNVENGLIPIIKAGKTERSKIVAESIALDSFSKALHEFEQENYYEALELLRHAVKEDPDFFEAYMKMADTLMMLGEDVAATRILAIAGKIRPEHPKVLERIVRVGTRKGPRETAIAIMKSAIDRMDGDPVFIGDMGAVCFEQGWVEEAIAFYEDALRLDPNLIHVYNRLGMAQSRAKNFDSSLAMYNRALEIDPNDAGVHFNIGMMYYRMKENDKAYDYFEKAGKLDPAREEATQWAEKMKSAMAS